jgi:hypothetical protein
MSEEVGGEGYAEVRSILPGVLIGISLPFVIASALVIWYFVQNQPTSISEEARDQIVGSASIVH